MDRYETKSTWRDHIDAIGIALAIMVIPVAIGMSVGTCSVNVRLSVNSSNTVSVDTNQRDEYDTP